MMDVQSLEWRRSGEFWPTQPSYVVSHLPLRPQHAFPPHLTSITPALRELMAVANAARELEEGGCAHSTVAQLDRRAAELLDTVAERVREERDRNALRQRAALLRSGDFQPSEEERGTIYGFRERELLVLYGRLKTWCRKGDGPLHSAFVALPCESLNEAVDELDRNDPLGLVQRHLGDERLVLAEPPVFSVTELAMCAGEANRHPKHFSYFLPEDECGLERPASVGGRGSKTVVFANLYVHRYATSSYPRLERCVRGLETLEQRPGAVADCLILWMRGHDLGHALRYEGTDLSLNHAAVGVYPMMCLEEALADCFGLLILLGSKTRALQTLSQHDRLAPFLGEMLRYLGRGRGVFQDSDAALLEVAYFTEYGAIDWHGNELTVDVEKITSATIELARLLSRAVLAHDEQLLKNLSARYLSADGESARAVLHNVRTLNTRCRDLPTSTTYSTRP